MAYDDEMDEYRHLRQWTAGKKPAAQGRSWRRLQQAAAVIVPDRVESVVGDGVGCLVAALGIIVVEVGIPMVLLLYGRYIVDVLVLPMDGGMLSLQAFTRHVVLLTLQITGVATAVLSALHIVSVCWRVGIAPRR